jgi:hypothetical protein
MSKGFRKPFFVSYTIAFVSHEFLSLFKTSINKIVFLLFLIIEDRMKDRHSQFCIYIEGY